jgi:hypothetical protein
MLERSPDREAALSVLHETLRSLVPYDAMVVYRRAGERLIPADSDLGEYRMLASLEIPIGMGFIGMGCGDGKSILNGNPSVEPGYLNDPTRFSVLGSALAVPLETTNGILGVLSVYREGRDAFSTRN